MKKKITNIVSILLLNLLILSVLGGCAKIEEFGAVTEDLAVSYELDEKAVIIDQTSYKASGDKLAVVQSRMTKQIENEYLELYTGTYYDIAVVDKETGKVFFSNEAIYDYDESKLEDLEAERKKVVLSQIELDYFDGNKKVSMSSYPDCFNDKEKEGVHFTVTDGALRAVYLLGQKTSDMILVSAFTKETYEMYMNTLEEMLANGQINRIKYGYFPNAYTQIVYDRLNDTQKKEYLDKYPLLKELGELYVIKPYLGSRLQKNLEEINAILGINREVMEREAISTGYADGLKNKTPFYEIPVVYRLQGKDLVVTVETENIECEPYYKMTKLTVLPGFGANKPTDDGYMFLPEKSGVIIANNASAYEMNNMSVSFYGTDYGKNYIFLDEIDRYASMPVFGVKSGDSAVFGIVESGDAVAGAGIRLNNAFSRYNLIAPFFTYLTVSEYGMEGIDYLFTSIKQITPYTVRYHFLYGDDANYSGMARYYQKYLESVGDITRNDKAKEIPFDLTLIGSITKVVKKFGIPMESPVAATTFSQASEIIKDLSDNGIIDMDIVYTGAINGGLDYKSPSLLEFQSELGGLNDYTSLNATANGLGYGLYLGVDITNVYKKGNGINSQNDLSKNVSRTNAMYFDFSPAGRYTRGLRYSYIVNPLNYKAVLTSFIKNYPSVDKNVYLASIGAALSGNYGNDSHATRNEAAELSVAALEQLSGYKLKLDSGNKYVLPYADSLTNVETSSGNSRLESYGIPFVGMVLKGYIEYTPYSLNLESDYDIAFLKAVESGAGLSFTLMDADPLLLVNTHYTNMFSVNYDVWRDRIISTYNRLDNDFRLLANERIIGHRRLKEQVYEVLYENGTRIIVNYTNAEIEIDNTTVGALDYSVLAKEGE